MTSDFNILENAYLMELTMDFYIHSMNITWHSAQGEFLKGNLFGELV